MLTSFFIIFIWREADREEIQRIFEPPSNLYRKKALQTIVCKAFTTAGDRNRTCTVSHQNLNLARLPVPPHPHLVVSTYIICTNR